MNTTFECKLDQYKANFLSGFSLSSHESYSRYKRRLEFNLRYAYLKSISTRGESYSKPMPAKENITHVGDYECDGFE